MPDQPYPQELTVLRQRNSQLEQKFKELTQINQALTAEIAQLRHTNAVHQQTQASLQKYLDELIDFYHNAPCGYHSLDADGVFVQMNDTELAWLGYTRTEIIGKKRFVDLLSPASIESFKANFGVFKQQGWVRDLEFELICADGTLLPVLLSSTAVYDTAGNYVRIRSTVFNVREQKQTERRLKQAKEALEEIADERTLELQGIVRQLRHEQEFTHVVVENVSDGVVACDADGRLKLFNRAAREWHGCDPREVPPDLWTSLYDLYEADGTTPLQTERIPLLRAFSGESVRQAGMAIVVRGQEPRYLVASGDPLFDATGQKIGAVVAMHDVTERKRSEEALYKSETQLRQQALDLERTLRDLQYTQAQLIQSEKMSSLGQLVAGVAHEINNPVNFISGNLSHANDYTQDLLNLIRLYQQHYDTPDSAIQQAIEAIDLDFLVEDLPKLLTSIKVGADRIQKIVASLRIFSRMDEAECKAVNIHDGIDSTLMILQNRLKAKGDRPAIHVIKRYGDLPLVECYAGQLNQVFMNILSNAIDALEESFAKGYWTPQEQSHFNDERTIVQVAPTITLRTKKSDSECISISIADNGIGMSESVLERIFNPFFTTKPVGKGTGMGLSISHQIITDRHQGRLHCCSTVEQGTEFVIQIPVCQNGTNPPMPESLMAKSVGHI